MDTTNQVKTSSRPQLTVEQIEQQLARPCITNEEIIALLPIWVREPPENRVARLIRYARHDNEEKSHGVRHVACLQLAHCCSASVLHEELGSNAQTFFPYVTQLVKFYAEHRMHSSLLGKECSTKIHSMLHAVRYAVRGDYRAPILGIPIEIVDRALLMIDAFESLVILRAFGTLPELYLRVVKDARFRMVLNYPDALTFEGWTALSLYGGGIAIENTPWRYTLNEQMRMHWVEQWPKIQDDLNTAGALVDLLNALSGKMHSDDKEMPAVIKTVQQLVSIARGIGQLAKGDSKKIRA